MMMTMMIKITAINGNDDQVDRSYDQDDNDDDQDKNGHDCIKDDD